MSEGVCAGGGGEGGDDDGCEAVVGGDVDGSCRLCGAVGGG